MNIGYPQGVASTFANATPVELKALYSTIQSRIMDTSTLLPDIRLLLDTIPNGNMEYKMQLDYADAAVTSRSLLDFTDLTFDVTKYYSRAMHASSKYVAEKIRGNVPISKRIETVENAYQRLRDGAVASLTADVLSILMGTMKNIIEDWYPYEAPSAPKTTTEDKTRAQDGWQDMYMPGTDVLDDLTPDTAPYKFFPILDLFSSKHGKQLASIATPGLGDVLLCDKDYYQKFYNSLLNRGGTPNMLIDRDWYGPLATRNNDIMSPSTDILRLRMGDRNWTVALYGDRDAMGNPPIFLDFIENDATAGYSNYPVAFAACANTWYCTYANWSMLETEILGAQQPHTITINSRWHAGAARMPGITQGAMWGRISNTTLLSKYQNLNLYKHNTYGMHQDDIEKFYTDTADSEYKAKGKEYKKAWDETVKRKSQSPDDRQDVLSIEARRGMTHIEKKKSEVLEMPL